MTPKESRVVVVVVGDAVVPASAGRSSTIAQSSVYFVASTWRERSRESSLSGFSSTSG